MELHSMKSSISNGWLFWFVNHISMSWNSELNVLKEIWFAGEISNKLSNGYYNYWQYYNELIILQQF